MDIEEGEEIVVGDVDPGFPVSVLGWWIGLVVDEDGLDALRTFEVDAEGVVEGVEDEGVEEEVTHRPVDAGWGVGHRGRGTEEWEEGDREEGDGGEVQGLLRFVHPRVVAIEAVPFPADHDEAVQGVVDAVTEHPGIERAASRAEGDTGDGCSDAGIPIQSPDRVEAEEEDGTGGEDGVEFPVHGGEVQQQIVAPEEEAEGNVESDGGDG